MICTKCGSQNADGIAFCSRCGAPMSASQVQPQYQTQQPQYQAQQPQYQAQQPQYQTQQPQYQTQQPQYQAQRTVMPGYNYMGIGAGRVTKQVIVKLLILLGTILSFVSCLVPFITVRYDDDYWYYNEQVSKLYLSDYAFVLIAVIVSIALITILNGKYDKYVIFTAGLSFFFWLIDYVRINIDYPSDDYIVSVSAGYFFLLFGSIIAVIGAACSWIWKLDKQ